MEFRECSGGLNYKATNKYQYLFQMVKVVVLLMVLAIALGQQEPTITNIALMSNYETQQDADTYNYYSVTFNATKKILMLTLDMNPSTLISIYLSLHFQKSNQVYYTYPNETHNTQECDQTSFQTCVVRFDNASLSDPQEVTVYFSIYSFGKVKYQLWALIDDIYNLNISSRYRIDFSKYESGLLQLSGQQMQGKEEVVMVLTYNTSGQVGVFKAEAAIDTIPNSQTSTWKISAITVGAFNKILKLPPIPSNQSYYILIEGQKGTKFSLYFYDSMPSAPTLSLNSSTVYLTNKALTYSAVSPFEHVNLPLFLQLSAYSGYGLFTVNYCNGYLTTTYQNLNGQNEQISITPLERQQCLAYVKNHSASFGLLAENIEIALTNVYELGYEIGLYEGGYQSSLRLNEQKYGLFLINETMRGYPIEIVVYNEEISVRYNQITQSQFKLVFGLEECKRKRNIYECSTLSTKNNGGGDIRFTPRPNHIYNLNITLQNSTNSSAPTPDKLQFLLELEHQYQQSTYLAPFRLYTQEIAENSYNYYRINLTRVADEQKIVITNNSQILIEVREINGDIYTLWSLTVPEPTYQKYLQFNNSQKISFAWSGKIEMLVDQTIELIYFSVKGNSDSLYQVQFTLDVDADIPVKYSQLVEGVQNNYMLTKDKPYQLLSYTSHILPYKIYIANTPKCIKMGYSLPLDQTCHSELPESFSSKVVYLNISNNSTRPFKFSVFVNSGEYFLTTLEAIIIGCPDTCYEVVNVLLESEGNVIHEGRGQIYAVDKPELVIYNSFLALACNTYPCRVKVNATLSYGGEMTLFLEGSDIKELDWKPTPVTFGNYPKKFIYPVHPRSELNSLLVYSAALQLDIYYNIINIHETQTNIKSFTFPEPAQHDSMHQGSPLRQIQVVNIDPEVIAAKGCTHSNSYCIVALSLYPNLKVEYNEKYFEGGVGYISANTYQIHFPINVVYHMEEQFTMSHFVHRRSADEIFSEKGYKIQIQPLSNCHPEIYYNPQGLPFSTLTPSYQDMVVNYYYGWINFTVLAEKECRYTVALTNSLYPILSANRHYLLMTNANQITVLFRTDFQSSFTIETQFQDPNYKLDYIGVNRVKESVGFVEPLPGKADYYSSNSSRLAVNSHEGYNLYIITISTIPKSAFSSFNNEQQLDVIIRTNRLVVLSRNQEEKHEVKTNSIASYQFSSTGSVAVFLSTSDSYLSVLINKNYNRTEVSRFVLSPLSSPWSHIFASNSELVTYDLTLLNEGISDSNITVMFEEEDTLSFTTLYQGIVSYDSFVRLNEKNCYTFKTELIVGQDHIEIDLVAAEGGPEFQNVSYSATTVNSVVWSNIQRIQLQPAVYKLTFQFVPDQRYTVCFWTTSPSSLGQQYYLLLNDPALPHIVEGRPHLQLNENQYDTFQLVEEGYNELIMIQVTSCLDVEENRRILVGSNSFIDCELGRYTDLVEVYKTKNSIYAQLQVGEGYYYLGVKNDLSSSLSTSDPPPPPFANCYMLQYQNIARESQMLSRFWELPDTRIVKIYSTTDDDNNVVYHVELPEIVLNDDETRQDNIQITYQLFMLEYNNATSKADPIEVEIRCPGFTDKKNREHNLKQALLPKVINRTISFSHRSQQQFNDNKGKPLFHFKPEEIPQQFNLTGRVTVSASQQKFAFYYDNSQADLTQLQNGSRIGPVAITLIVLVVLVIAGVGAYGLWTHRQKRKRKQEKNLEMLSYVTDKNSQSNPKKYGQLQEELN